jgi:hypothetical protein
MAAQLQIVNLALIRLGQKTIASMTEASVAARTASQLWDMDRQETLRGYPWNFSMRFVRHLAKSPFFSDPTEVPTPAKPRVPDYQFAYQIPTDCLSARKVYDPSMKFLQLDLLDSMFFDTYPAAIVQGLLNESDTSRFVVREEHTLFTDVACAGLFYTYDVTDTAKFDNRFVSTLAYRLAMDLAAAITGSASKVQALTTLYMQSLAAARVADAQEGKTRAQAGQSFLRSRV